MYVLTLIAYFLLYHIASLMSKHIEVQHLDYCIQIIIFPNEVIRGKIRYREASISSSILHFGR